MKIVISSSGENKESHLDKRFGRCEYFIIYNTETKEFDSIANHGASSSGGAGIAAASQVIEENVQVVITGNLGPNAYELIEKAEIKAYSCAEVTVMEAIELFEKNQLSEINIPGISHQGMR